MRWVVLLFFLPILVQAQGDRITPYPTSKLAKYAALFQQPDNIQSSFDLELFADKLELKKIKERDEKEFLKFLFRKTHQQILHSFKEYSSFSDLLDKGEYNCLTGTALYAVLLDHFGFTYTITETNYHIFLIAKTNSGNVLIEATDPANGFVDKSTEIEERINTYRQNVIQQAQVGKSYYHFNFELYNTVTLDQMVGLLYYNRAVKAFNDKQLGESIQYLDRAFARYQSPRIDEFSKILLLSVAESDLDQDVRTSYVRKLQQIRKKKTEFVASVAESH
ncbi:MAG TPA: hypothetical protein VGK59_14240 [Ohtaekwangia sp.]